MRGHLYVSAMQHKGTASGEKKAARNGLCSVCNVLYVFCFLVFALEYFCVYGRINMHESVHLHSTSFLQLHFQSTAAQKGGG